MVVGDLHHRADVLDRQQDRRAHDRLEDGARSWSGGGSWPGEWISSSPSGHLDLVRDRRRRLDHVDVVLALEALLHDLHVQQAEEAAAEAEAERPRR